MRKILLVSIGLFIFGVLSVGCDMQREETAVLAAGDPVRGEALFLTTCFACHGTDARGLPGQGKDLTTSEFTRGLSDGEFVEFVKNGRDINDPLNTTGVDMPPRGGNPALTDQDLYDIVAFIRTLEK